LIIKSALGQVKTPLFASEPSDEEREVLALLGEGFLSNDIPMDLED
jgi:hypothetical protein